METSGCEHTRMRATPEVLVLRETFQIARGAAALAPGELPRPNGAYWGTVVDARGQYVVPGFIDVHVHCCGGQANDPEYVYKLWLGHGVTTVRGVPCGLPKAAQGCVARVTPARFATSRKPA